ncbi:MAG: hypothetical protein JSU68_11220 [Phycisphaerales bacterium]|nr:MAG: hypothetical protein JSU68_11220 [Phycisphaerales bacterium]
MNHDMYKRIAALTLGCFLITSAPLALADESEAKEHLQQIAKRVKEAEQRLDQVRAAEQAGLVSPAWVEGARKELEEARLEMALAELESKRAEGALSDSQFEAEAGKIQKALAANRVQHVRGLVERLRALYEAGRVDAAALKNAETQLALAQLDEELVELEAMEATGEIKPVDKAARYAAIIRKRAALLHKEAAAKLERAKMRYEFGHTDAMDVHWATLELAEAEAAVRSAEIEAEATLGEISWKDAERRSAELHAKTAARRVELLEQIVRLSDGAVTAGLLKEDALQGPRDDLEHAKEELKAAKSKLEQVGD